jgi:hypothetical protein
MGDSKILKKFRRICDLLKAEYVIDGVVEDFDTIYPVPPERLTRGMTINLGDEKRLVHFRFTKKPPVDIGDKVFVVGKDYSIRERSVLPAVILSPEEKWVLFSREDLLKRPDKLELAITLVGAGIFVVSWLIARELYPPLAFGIFVAFILFCPPPFVLSYLRRPRLYNCSEEECQLLLEEMGGRFAPKVKATERQTRRTF